MAGYALALEYELEVPTLRRLITVSKRTQWDADDINWAEEVHGGAYERILEWQGALRSDYVRALSPSKKEQLARQFVSFDFSQILHGEQAAMMLAGQLTNSVDDLDAKIFAAIQVKDEARHVEAVHHMVRRIGPVYPMGPMLKQTLDHLIVCLIWPKQVLGLQLFLEARALLSFRQHLLFVDDPIFRQACTAIERDEAQHVAFGVQYLKTGVEQLDARERAELVEYGAWLDKSIWSMTKSGEYKAVFDECDLDFAEFEATYRPPSMLRPEMSAASKKSAEMMHGQFRRWFFSALERVGLRDVAELRAKQLGIDLTKVSIEPEVRADAPPLESVLPWVKPLEDPTEVKTKKPKKPLAKKKPARA